MSRRGAAAQKQEHRAACYYWAMRWAILFLFVGMFTIAPQQLLSQEPAGEKTQPRSEFWTREGFPSDQQRMVREYRARGTADAWSRARCIAYLRDLDLIIERVRRASGNLGVRYLSQWHYCAAYAFPADTPAECAESISRYRRLTARMPKLRRSRVPEYLTSFCGVRVG
jgi:hypothetical protein